MIRWPDERLSRHFSSYHCEFTNRRWSIHSLAKRLTTAGVLELTADHTVSQHRDEHVYSKGCHRDAVQSSHQHQVYRWEHKCVVLALRVQVTGATRTRVFPMLIALYQTPEESRKAGVVYKTHPQLMRGLPATLMRCFPQRKLCLPVMDSKQSITFSEALSSVRYNPRNDYFFPHQTPQKLGRKVSARRKWAIPNTLA